MNVGELKEIIKDLNDDVEIVTCDDSYGDYQAYLLGSGNVTIDTGYSDGFGVNNFDEDEEDEDKKEETFLFINVGG